MNVPDALMIMLLTAVGVVLLGVFALSLLWVYQDAEYRGKSGVLVALLCALISWPLSLVIWCVFRPEARQDPGEVPLEWFWA